MALIPEAVASRSGVAPAPRGAAADDDVVPGSNVQLVVDNTSAGAVTVTVTAVRRCSQGSLHDIVVSVPATSKRVIGPITDDFANAATGLARVTYSATAGVNVHTQRV